MPAAPGSPAKLGPGLHRPVVINLHVVKVTVSVVLQVEGLKDQLDQVPWRDADEPGTVGTVGVDGGMTRTGDGSRWVAQSSTTA